MRYKYTLLAILMSMLLVAPAFAFWHPPPDEIPVPTCPYFGIMVNGKWAASPATAYNFTEPGLYCTDFTVEVWFANVSDLYGYEFILNWNSVYYNLKSGPVINKIWDPMQIYVNKSFASDTWKVVASAMDPAPGLPLGNYLLATFTFHIMNDVCNLQGTVHTGFWLTGLKASDSCSKPIDPICNPINAYVDLVPVKPKIWIDPPSENNSKVHDKFTMTIKYENIVKMKDVYLVVSWSGYYVAAEGGFYTALLCTKVADIVINEAVFPKANRTGGDVLNVVSPNCSKRHTTLADASGHVELYIKMDCTFPLINGSDWIMKITFEKCDPWYCGAQPGYTRTGEHDWKLDCAETDITLSGYFSVYCPDAGIQEFYKDVTVGNAHYIFKPIPGDLNGSGHVDIVDLMIEAGYYGKGNSEAPWTWIPGYYYDLNKDGYIDIFDLVIVAKNICRSVP
jgi:hypothetical protein